jgi:hypothetical protein
MSEVLGLQGLDSGQPELSFDRELLSSLYSIVCCT